ncbi:MAG: NUDIX domain-containing protein [Candidatus Marsarchaeota archaeon]|jgi:8-oxo-dGTP pyrophosphatase MutT (NUDIX family)|nr:NUDIX domain-containing protein [Candidatus Marsarchaeota archaeon]
MDSKGDYSDEIVGIIGVFGGEVPYIKRVPQAKLYPGKWCIPSGHMKAGETPAEAAARELEEETGYGVPKGERIDELGKFTFLADMDGGKKINLNISLLLYITEEKPDIHICDEHTESKYIALEVLSDKERLFLYNHTRGATDFTPIDALIIDKYMPEAYGRYKATIKSRAKSIA